MRTVRAAAVWLLAAGGEEGVEGKAAVLLLVVFLVLVLVLVLVLLVLVVLKTEKEKETGKTAMRAAIHHT